jgi:hypothetical protein
VECVSTHRKLISKVCGGSERLSRMVASVPLRICRGFLRVSRSRTPWKECRSGGETQNSFRIPLFPLPHLTSCLVSLESSVCTTSENLTRLGMSPFSSCLVSCECSGASSFPLSLPPLSLFADDYFSLGSVSESSLPSSSSTCAPSEFQSG